MHRTYAAKSRGSKQTRDSLLKLPRCESEPSVSIGNPRGLNDEYRDNQSSIITKMCKAKKYMSNTNLKVGAWSSGDARRPAFRDENRKLPEE